MVRKSQGQARWVDVGEIPHLSWSRLSGCSEKLVCSLRTPCEGATCRCLHRASSDLQREEQQNTFHSRAAQTQTWLTFRLVLRLGVLPFSHSDDPHSSGNTKRKVNRRPTVNISALSSHWDQLLEVLGVWPVTPEHTLDTIRQQSFTHCYLWTATPRTGACSWSQRRWGL